MPAIRVIACDIFGTTVDWYIGVTKQIGETFQGLGIELDPGQLASDWRAQYGPSMQRVREGERGWANLDVLHRDSLDELLRQRGIADTVDEPARRRLVRAWHHLPAWDDTIPGLTRLRTRHVIAALSNGGFALLTNLVKAAGLPFDCIISAELIRAYKPDLRVYRAAAALLDVEAGQVLMVAAHRRDLEGAAEAGMRTAFLERPTEQGPDGSADRVVNGSSDFTVSSFVQLADQLGA
jgi:2-haloacid dehalogenase